MNKSQKTKKDLLEYIKDLESQIKSLKENKKFGLVWEDQPETKIEKELKENYPTLKLVPELTVAKEEENGSTPTHVLIEGDNLHALTALQATHKGKIDVICIDPPYNTGNKDFIYNDSFVNSDDNFRHSKWLSFMEKRLLLAKELLSETGIIFVSIDDNEQAQLRMLMHAIFGEKNVEQMIWHKVGDDSGRLKVTKRFRREHEYILVGYKNIHLSDFFKYEATRNYKNEYTNPDNDPRGAYKQGIISHTEAKSKTAGKNYFEVVTPSGRLIKRQWRVTESEFKELVKDNRIYFGKKGNSVPSLKVFISEKKMETPMSLLVNFGTAKSAGIVLREILDVNSFSYPKPVGLIKHLVQITTKHSKNSTILDFFAGSGTTGHAVAALNAEDGGQRQAILVTNNENNICRDVTYKRMKAVLTGEWADGKPHEPLPGSLQFYEIELIPKEQQ